MSKLEDEYHETLAKLRKKLGYDFAQHVDRTCLTQAARVDRGFLKASRRPGARRWKRGTEHPHDAMLMKCIRDFAKAKGLAGASRPRRKQKR